MNDRLASTNWAFVPIREGSKAPIEEGWQNKPYTYGELPEIGSDHEHEITINKGTGQKKRFKTKIGGYGVLSGPLSGGLVALDHDGVSVDDWLAERRIELPKTKTVSAGRKGHHQSFYLMLENLWDLVDNKVIYTGVTKQEYGKEVKEQIDLRWSGRQSLVEGTHPESGNQYQIIEWVDEIPYLPEALIKLMLKDISEADEREHFERDKEAKQFGVTKTLKEWAYEYLSYIPISDLDWYKWRNILFAMESCGFDETEARNISATSSKHTDKGFDDVWKHIKGLPGPDIHYLGKRAKEYGWVSPYKGKRKPKQQAQGQGFGVNADDAHDEQEEQEFLGEEVDSFLTTVENEFDISTLLFSGLAEKFKVLAERLGLPPIVYLFCLLPVTASLLKVGTRLLVAESTNYLVPAIIWLALVADSGVGKSIVFNHIIGALVTLELELREQHKAAHAEWKKEHEDWKELKKESPGQEGDEPQEPQPRTLFFDDFTFEAVGPALEKHPNCGAVVAVDELAGFLKRMEGEYKSGSSSERPKWLSAYNGGTVKNDRVTKKGFLLKNTSISQIGTIQPSVLKRCMGNLHDVDGFWARYGFLYVPDKEMPSPIGFGKYDLSEYLLDCYKKLDALPPKTYRLSAEAQTVWDDWHKWIEAQRLDEARPVIKALYPKLRDLAARVALVVHCVNGVLHWEETPKSEVSADTLKASIEFAKFCLGQALFIYGQAGISNHADSAKIVRFIEKFQHHPAITSRMVRNWSHPKMTAKDCRKFMAQLVTLGYATNNGLDFTDKSYQITLSISSKTQSIQSTFPENQSGQAFEASKTQSIIQSNGLPFQSTFSDSTVQVEQFSKNGLDSQSNGLKNGLAQTPLEALSGNGFNKNGLDGLDFLEKQDVSDCYGDDW